MTDIITVFQTTINILFDKKSCIAAHNRGHANHLGKN